MPEAPTEMNPRKEAYVWQRRTEDKCAHVSTMMAETGITKASVVPISWLKAQFEKIAALQPDVETVWIAADANGSIYIESWEEDASPFRDYPEESGGASMDPPGWNNDWPEINLP